MIILARSFLPFSRLSKIASDLVSPLTLFVLRREYRAAVSILEACTIARATFTNNTRLLCTLLVLSSRDDLILALADQCYFPHQIFHLMAKFSLSLSLCLLPPALTLSLSLSLSLHDGKALDVLDTRYAI